MPRLTTDPRAKCSDIEFITHFERLGADKVSKLLGVAVQNVYMRRTRLERKYQRQITPPGGTSATRFGVKHPGRITYPLKNGTILVGSDAHTWPGPQSTAMRAFIRFAKDLQPDFLVLNGDMLDFCQISRWPSNWETRPDVYQELEAVQDHLHELAMAAGRRTKRIWTFGNHDHRLELAIANKLPELKKMHGVHLKDWFPDWQPCWSVWIERVVIKHRGPANGVHSNYNNVLKSGRDLVAGHLHSLGYTAFTNYDGTLYGCNTGMLADPYAPQFSYIEDNPRNWRQGFLILTIRDGRLMLPEVAQVWGDNSVEYRGKVITV